KETDSQEGGSYIFFLKQAQPAMVRVIYDGNGATGGSVPVDSNKYLQGVTVTVLGNTGNLTRPGYRFAG
ncbi:MAG: hypothetical protein N3A02_00410, partial [Rectinema sp.]|nr:hypothetical protein [Rectinema sp.]